MVDLTISLDDSIIFNFTRPVSILFSSFNVPSDFSISNLCLAYIDEVLNQWICQDENLTITENGWIQGYTTHFTSFALLLGNAPAKNNDVKQNDNGAGGFEKFQHSVYFPVFIVGVIVVVVGIPSAFVARRIYLRKKSMLRKVASSQIE